MGKVSFNRTTKERMVLTKDGQEPGSSWLDGYIFSLFLSLSLHLSVRVSPLLVTFIYARICAHVTLRIIYMYVRLLYRYKVYCFIHGHTRRCDQWIATRRSENTRENVLREMGHATTLHLFLVKQDSTPKIDTLLLLFQRFVYQLLLYAVWTLEPWIQTKSN